MGTIADNDVLASFDLMIFSNETITTEPYSNASIQSRPHHLMQLHSHWSTFQPASYSNNIAIGILLSIISCVAIVGNSFVIFVFVRFRVLRTPACILTINLALSDLLMAATTFPITIAASFYGYWPFSSKVCDFFGFASALFGLLSINTLAGIAFDRREIIVGRRFWSTTNKKPMLLLCIAWLNSFICAVPPLLGWNKYILEPYGTACSFDFLTASWISRSFIIAISLVGFLMPLAVIVWCYATISSAVSKHERGLTRRLGYRSRSDSKYRLDLKTARTAFWCVILFCISWTPYAVVSWFGVLGGANLLTPIAVTVPALFAKASAMYNPLVYTVSHPRFRKTLTCLCVLGRRHRRPDSNPSVRYHKRLTCKISFQKPLTTDCES